VCVNRFSQFSSFSIRSSIKTLSTTNVSTHRNLTRPSRRFQLFVLKRSHLFLDVGRKAIINVVHCNLSNITRGCVLSGAFVVTYHPQPQRTIALLAVRKVFVSLTYCGNILIGIALERAANLASWFAKFRRHVIRSRNCLLMFASFVMLLRL
jgi:hypothetical protein